MRKSAFTLPAFSDKGGYVPKRKGKVFNLNGGGFLFRKAVGEPFDTQRLQRPYGLCSRFSAAGCSGSGIGIGIGDRSILREGCAATDRGIGRRTGISGKRQITVLRFPYKNVRVKRNRTQQKLFAPLLG